MKFCCRELKPKDWRFCPFCGKRIYDYTMDEDNDNAMDEDNKK